MVDTKDNSKEEPKFTFSYDKDNERLEVDANTFSPEGQQIFLDLIDDQEDEKQIAKNLRRTNTKLNDLRNGMKLRTAWIMENEINKTEEPNIEDIEGVEVIDESGDDKKTKQ